VEVEKVEYRQTAFQNFLSWTGGIALALFALWGGWKLLKTEIKNFLNENKMAEKFKTRLRVKEVYMSDPLSTKDEISTAQWGDKLPLTLRDDELLITEGEPEEDEVFSHENDTPERWTSPGRG